MNVFQPLPSSHDVLASLEADVIFHENIDAIIFYIFHNVMMVVYCVPPIFIIMHYVLGRFKVKHAETVWIFPSSFLCSFAFFIELISVSISIYNNLHGYRIFISIFNTSGFVFSTRFINSLAYDLFILLYSLPSDFFECLKIFFVSSSFFD